MGAHVWVRGVTMPRTRNRRTIITMIRPVTRSGDYNEQLSDAPIVLGREWGYVNTLGGRELERAVQVVGEATHQVELPSCNVTRSLLITDRIEANGQTLSIVHIDTSEEHRGLVILICHEGIMPKEWC